MDDNLQSDLVLLISNSAWILIGVGAFVFVLGFLGMCGACREEKCYLMTVCIVNYSRGE